MASTTTRTAPGFWRCTRCNTPNPTASYLTRCLGCGQPIPPFPTSQTVREASSEPENTGAPAPARGRKTLVAAAAYAAIVLALIGMIRGMALGWWPIAALVYLPRWLFLMPLVPLAIGAVRARRSIIHAVVLLDLLLVIGPWMGFNVPSGLGLSTPPPGPKIRVMTFHGGPINPEIQRHLLSYLDHHKIDIVCIQVSALSQELAASMLDEGWKFDRAGRIASRFPMARDYPSSTSLDRVKLKHPGGLTFLVASVQMPAAGVSDPDPWIDGLIQIRETLADSGSTPLIVAGDFQMPGDSQPMASLRRTYPSSHEQAGWGYGSTYPSNFPLFRMDHIVASRDWSFTRSWVGPKFGSDHLPVVAEAVLVDGKPRE